MITQEFVLSDQQSILHTFIRDAKVSTNLYRKRPAVIVCPGGSYLFCATKEGEPVAAHFAALGYHAFVLRYKTYLKAKITDLDNMPERNEGIGYPDHLLALMESMQLIHDHAKEWYVDTENVFVIGFSAGAHLTGLLSERWDDPEVLEKAEVELDATKLRPRGVMLCYPMLTVERLLLNVRASKDPLMRVQTDLVPKALVKEGDSGKEVAERLDLIKHVRSDMPPVFMWHTAEDDVTSGLDSTRFAAELLAHDVSCEFHLFREGRHGISLADETSAGSAADINPVCAVWPSLAWTWMKRIMA